VQNGVQAMRAPEQVLNPRGRAARAQLRARSLLRVADREVFVALSWLCCTALGLVFASGLVGTDSWLSLLSGRIVAANGLPHRDLLTVWGHGRPWVDQQWLAHVGIYGLFNLGGLRLLVLLTIGATVSSVGLLLTSARRTGSSAAAVAVAAMPLFLLVLPATAVRAQTFAYPLFAALVWLLWGRGRKATSAARLALTLPVLVVWANVHGSVLLGALFVAFAALESAAGRRDPRLMLFALAPAAVVLASPYGLDLVGYYHTVLASPSFGKYVTEWQAPSIRSEPVFFAAALVTTALVAARRRRFSPSELAAFAVVTLGGYLAVRNIVWFALLSLFLLPRALDVPLGSHRGDRRPRLNLTLVTFAALVVLVLTIGTAARSDAQLAASYRSAALDAAQRAIAVQPHARIWADERFADWLLYELPASRGHVVFDARFELLSRADFVGISNVRYHVGRNWSAALAGVGTLVVPRRALGDVRELVGCRGGGVAYVDPTLVVATLSVRSSRASRPGC
jgi:hypothetical protein